MKSNVVTAVLLLFLSFTSISCSGSGEGDDSQPVNGSGIIDEAGDFSYSFKLDQRCIGSCDEFKKYERCETAQKFKSKRAYCAGLQDSELNNGCAIEKRKERYLAECASNFEEINVGGYRYGTSGDDRLNGKSCGGRVNDSATRTAWCQDIANESSHNFCMWDDRRIKFVKNGCKGSFSNLPIELAEIDHGVKKLQNRSFTFKDREYITYKVYRKSFKISPTQTKILSVNRIKTWGDTCMNTSQAVYEGELIDLNSNEAIPFAPGSDQVVLDEGGLYLLNIKTLNLGMCKELHLDFRVNLD